MKEEDACAISFSALVFFSFTFAKVDNVINKKSHLEKGHTYTIQTHAQYKHMQYTKSVIHVAKVN